MPDVRRENWPGGERSEDGGRRPGSGATDSSLTVARPTTNAKRPIARLPTKTPAARSTPQNRKPSLTPSALRTIGFQNDTPNDYIKHGDYGNIVGKC